MLLHTTKFNLSVDIPRIFISNMNSSMDGKVFPKYYSRILMYNFDSYLTLGIRKKSIEAWKPYKQV
jgi:hypothetical protein